MLRTPCFILFLSTAVSGCSFAFVKGPLDNRIKDDSDSSSPPKCTTSKVIPWIDRLGFMYTGMATGMGLLWDVFDHEINDSELSNWTWATGLALATVYGVSATLGFRRVDGCQKAVRERPAGLPQPQADLVADDSAWQAVSPLSHDSYFVQE